MFDDATREILDDAVGVLELGPGEERGVAADVRQQQVSVLDTSSLHDTTLGRCCRHASGCHSRERNEWS